MYSDKGTSKGNSHICSPWQQKWFFLCFEISCISQLNFGSWSCATNETDTVIPCQGVDCKPEASVMENTCSYHSWLVSFDVLHPDLDNTFQTSCQQAAKTSRLCCGTANGIWLCCGLDSPCCYGQGKWAILREKRAGIEYNRHSKSSSWQTRKSNICTQSFWKSVVGTASLRCFMTFRVWF